MSFSTTAASSISESSLSRSHIPDELAGFSLIRVCRPDCTVHSNCDNGGKRPVSSVDDIQSKSEVSQWVQEGGNAGIVPKANDELAILDIDSDQLAALASRYLPETFTVETQSGFHRYYRVPGWDRNFGWGELGSIRANNWMAVIPPSIHPTGTRYTVDRKSPIARISPRELELVVDKIQESQSESDSRPHSSQIPTKSVGALDFIQSDSIRNRIERYLHESNPDHSDRIWLVGWLYHVPENPNLKEQDIVDLIMQKAQWSNLNRDIVEEQVDSVIKSSG